MAQAYSAFQTASIPPFRQGIVARGEHSDARENCLARGVASRGDGETEGRFFAAGTIFFYSSPLTVIFLCLVRVNVLFQKCEPALQLKGLTVLPVD